MNSHWIAEVDASWTLFLDRDGVLNQKIDGDYVKTMEELKILPGVLEALYRLTGQFYKIVVVTNQQGIGKGIMTHEDLSVVHNHLVHQIENAGGKIDQVYYSPELAYLETATRKPAPGMAYQAKQDFPFINFEKSIMVGDSQSDIDFGKNLNMKTVWISRKINPCNGFDLSVQSLLEFSKLMNY